MIKKSLLLIEDMGWNIRCKYNYMLHGPYGLAKTIEKMPFRFSIKYLRKYGATIGENCRFERGLNIHRPLGKRPFENLFIGNEVYLGHNIILDLSMKIIIRDNVDIGARCQLWTHAGYYDVAKSNNPTYAENYGELIIDKYVIIYSNAIITQGVQIGTFARIGACSLVNKNVAEYSLTGGVPAREIKSYNKGR